MRNPLPVEIVQYQLPVFPEMTTDMFSPQSGRVLRHHPMWKHFDSGDQPKCNRCSATFSKNDSVSVFLNHMKKKHQEVDVSDVTVVSRPARRALRSSTARPINYAESSPRYSRSRSSSESEAADPDYLESQAADPDYIESQATAVTTPRSTQNTPITIITLSSQRTSTQGTGRSYTPVKLISDDESDNDEVPTRTVSPAPPPSFRGEDSESATPPPAKKRRQTTGSQNDFTDFDSWVKDSGFMTMKANELPGVNFVFEDSTSFKFVEDGGKRLVFKIKSDHVVVKTLDSDGDLEKQFQWPKGVGFIALVLGTVDLTFKFC